LFISRLNDDRQSDFDESKKNLKWRIKPSERKSEWYSGFRLFMEDEEHKKTTETFVTTVVQPIDLSPTSLKKAWKLNREKQERFLQQYCQDRHKALGNDLAAAHFLVFREGKVKFVDQDRWVKADQEGYNSLPDRYVSTMLIEAIDCEGMELYYEGLENLRRLKHLRFASFKNIEFFDDWCLDRISGAEFESLEVLNLSGTKVTEKGLQALYRIPSLKKLIIDDPRRNTQWELVIAMLNEIMPELEVVATPVDLKAVKA
jgi:hypothetical protein